jgi:DNA-binding NarL/FixJ family response regulator
VLLVDDHAMLVQALCVVLEQDGMAVRMATDVDDQAVFAEAEDFRPEVVLLDLHLRRDRTSIPLIGPLTAMGARVLMLTASDQPAELAACLQAGAVAVLSKSEALEASVEAVRLALAGASVRARQGQELRCAGRRAQAQEATLLEPFERLTPRERQVLTALVDGKSAEEVAAEHHISVRTVRSHLEAIRSKLGVRSQLAAVALARQVGWTDRHPGT